MHNPANEHQRAVALAIHHIERLQAGKLENA